MGAMTDIILKDHNPWHEEFIVDLDHGFKQ